MESLGNSMGENTPNTVKLEEKNELFSVEFCVALVPFLVFSLFIWPD